MDRMKVEVLVTAGFCIAVILLNLWTLKRAEKVEARVKYMLAEDHRLCPLCGDHYKDEVC